jgi:hypothetical protein
MKNWNLKNQKMKNWNLKNQKMKNWNLKNQKMKNWGMRDPPFAVPGENEKQEMKNKKRVGGLPSQHRRCRDITSTP